MRKLILFLLLIPSILFSVDFTIEYIDGTATCVGKEEELFPGDVLDSGASIKVGKDTLVELYCAGQKYTLSQPGVYSLTELLNKRTIQQKVGGLSSIKSKLSRFLFQKESDNESAVGGVRGAAVEKIETESMEWEDDADPVTLIIEGFKYIDEGDYEAALLNFEDAEIVGDEEVADQAILYQAYVYGLLGEMDQAFRFINFIEDPRNTFFYADYLIISCSLLLTAGDAEGVLESVGDIPPEIEDAKDRAQLMFFKILAFDQLGDIDARDDLITRLNTDYSGTDAANTTNEIF